MSRSDVSPVYGPTNPSPTQQKLQAITRYGSIIELIPEREIQYRELHAEVWPEVVAAIKKANIQNYNIFVVSLGEKRYLVSYWEYVGSDAEQDIASIAEDPTTRDRWWPLTDACQRRLSGTPETEQWFPMELVMHID